VAEIARSVYEELFLQLPDSRDMQACRRYLADVELPTVEELEQAAVEGGAMTIVEMLVAALEEALDQTEDGRAHDGQRCYESFCWVDDALVALDQVSDG
jgi:hypothetical protein